MADDIVSSGGSGAARNPGRPALRAPGRIAALVALAVLIPVLASQPAVPRAAPQAARSYPGSLAARIPLAGVAGLAQAGDRLWRSPAA